MAVFSLDTCRMTGLVAATRERGFRYYLAVAEAPPPGWYPDPTGSGGTMYWDGGQWLPSSQHWGNPSQAEQQRNAQPRAWQPAPSSSRTDADRNRPLSRPAPVSGPQLSPVWQRRFAFFSQYGGSTSTPQSRAALKEMSFGERLRLTSNFPAFFFGPFYFMFKGMWRKGLTLLGAGFLLVEIIAVLHLPFGVLRTAVIALGLAAQLSANYAYYLHVTRASKSWNPFEGFSTGKRQKT